MIRVCPERDAQCPYGINCPFADTQYRCKPGWGGTVKRDTSSPDVDELATLRARVAELEAANRKLAVECLSYLGQLMESDDSAALKE